MRYQASRLALFGCLLFATVTGCSSKKEGPASRPTVVRYVPVKMEEVTDYEFFTGRTAAVEFLEVRARVTGYLVGIDFKPGTPIQKDKRLFKIDPRPYKATFDQADADVKLADASLKLATADVARAKELAKTPGAISQQDTDKYAATEEQAAASLLKAKANRESADLNLKFTDVTSPIEGMVGRNLLTLGNLVTADITLLTTVVAEDPIWAYCDVDERTMLRVQELIREGKVKGARREDSKFPVELGLASEGERFPHKGVIDFVNTQVDSSTGTLQVRGVFSNPLPGKDLPRVLSPGLFVRVRLPVGEAHKSLVVPQAAIGRDQGKTYLLVVDDESVVEYRPVTLGAEQPGGMQVVVPVQVVRTEKGLRAVTEKEKGEPSLKEREKVVVSGLQRVRPGLKVEAKPYE